MELKELIQKLSTEELKEPDIEKLMEDFVANKLLKSETLQKAFGMTDQQLENLYRHGYELYQKDNYAESVTFFNWLVILNPFIPKYWMGLAANRQLLGQYEKALQAYSIAALEDKVDPYPHFHAYECYEAMGNREEGKNALIEAKERAGSHSIYSSLRQEIRKIMVK